MEKIENPTRQIIEDELKLGSRICINNKLELKSFRQKQRYEYGEYLITSYHQYEMVINGDLIEKMFEDHKRIRNNGPLNADLINYSEIEQAPPILNIDRIALKNHRFHQIRNMDETIGRLHMAYPCLKCINMNNVCVAGGALCAAAKDDSSKDIDLFFYELSAEQILEKVDDIYDSLNEYYEVTRYDNRQVVTFVLSNGKYIQCILRSYRNMAEIIYGFDIGACQLLYDGNVIWTTPAGRIAYETGYNIIDVEVRRHTYEKRLVKYFVKYGFGIIMPKMVTKELIFTLPYLSVINHDRYNKMLWKGKVLEDCTINIKVNNVVIYGEYDFGINYLDPYDIMRFNVKCFEQQSDMYIAKHGCPVSVKKYSPLWVRYGWDYTEEKVNDIGDKINKSNIVVKFEVNPWNYRTAFQNANLCTEDEWCGL